ncbi:hypothetical protein ACIP6Q_13715 [Streptomyces bobili]|uniref:hypothetical protein n=1 Tax=Streptomyces bobili TaxID=67280 RepID=UPI003830F38A
MRGGRPSVLTGAVGFGADAGRHSATLTPHGCLPLSICPTWSPPSATRSPCPSSPRAESPPDVTAALRAGAVAAMVGTVLLRTQES